MKTNTICIEADQISIVSKRGPLIILSILLLLSLFLLLLPVAGVLANLLWGNGFHFGYLIAFLICWGIAYHLVKILLWNIEGKEVFKLKENEIEYTAHYKFFVDGQKTISIDTLMFERLSGRTGRDTLKRIKISNQQDYLESVLEISLTDLALLEEKIKTRYNTPS